MAWSYNLSHFNQFLQLQDKPITPCCKSWTWNIIDAFMLWILITSIKSYYNISHEKISFSSSGGPISFLGLPQNHLDLVFASSQRHVPSKLPGPQSCFSSSKYFGSMSPTHFFWKEKHWPLGQTTQAIWKSHHFFHSTTGGFHPSLPRLGCLGKTPLPRVFVRPRVPKDKLSLGPMRMLN